MLRKLLVGSLVALTWSAAARAQETAPAPETTGEDQEAPPLTFAVEVEQVIVDLVVTDKEGNPVSGISRDDLIVSEDKIPQGVASFEAVELPDALIAEPLARERISQNSGQSSDRGRTFVVIFDDLNVGTHRARDAKAAVAAFLKNGVREGDYVTLVSTSGTAWWTSRMEAGREKLIDTLKNLEGRVTPEHTQEQMTDYEAMRIHRFRDSQVMGQVLQRFEKYGVSMLAKRDQSDPLTGTINDPYVTAKATAQFFQVRTRLRVALEVIERALNGLSGTKGRKSVILVSDGFIYDPRLDEFKRVNDASRRANAAIYFVNSRGLDGMPDEFSAEFGPRQAGSDLTLAWANKSRIDDGSENLADNSGGFTVRNKNDLAKGIQRIAKETQLYYLLGYVSTNSARDGAYREIEVKFKRGKGKGLKIRARKGYYADTPDGATALTGKEGVDPIIQSALDSPWPRDGIPLRMTSYVGAEQMLGRAGVLVVTEVDIRGLRFQEVEGRQVSEIQFLLVVAQRDTGEFLRYDQAITLRLRPSTHERLTKVWFPIARDFELSAGDHQAKIIVRETATGIIGSVSHEFEVPSQAEFRVSTPILSDTHKRTEDGADVQAQALARREFPKGSQLVCRFEVYGATKDKSTGMPKVVQGYKVLSSDGSELLNLPESEIQPTSLGALSRLFGFPLDEAPLGDYEIVMTVRDELAGKTLEVREPFAVVAPVADAAPDATAANRPVASP